MFIWTCVWQCACVFALFPDTCRSSVLPGYSDPCYSLVSCSRVPYGTSLFLALHELKTCVHCTREQGQQQNQQMAPSRPTISVEKGAAHLKWNLATRYCLIGENSLSNTCQIYVQSRGMRMYLSLSINRHLLCICTRAQSLNMKLHKPTMLHARNNSFTLKNPHAF